MKVELGPRPSRFPNAWAALRAHWMLYAFEAAELAAFMVSACGFTVLLFHAGAGLNPWVARGLMGLAMGATAVGIIKSPAGEASGAHFNPAISLTFYRLGKIGPYDTMFYVVGHFVGAISGVGLAVLALGRRRLAEPAVNYVVTVPGLGGVWGAFAAEFGMAALLMGMVLYTSNRARWKGWTTWLVGVLIANYILFLAPVSGFSINPARTVGSAAWAGVWTSVWVYFVAPLAGMLAAAEGYARAQRDEGVVKELRSYVRHRHLVQR